MQMDSVCVHGGVCLQGKVRIQGSKNASLPILAATLLTKGENVVYNCPKITDVFQMKQLLRSIGCKIRERCDCVSVNADQIRSGKLPAEAVQGMRSSVCMLGALLARCGEVTMEYPGGCVIGARPIDLHLKALEKMGAIFHIENGMIHGIVPEGFCGAEVCFPKVSVGATENVILAAVLAKGRTRIIHAAKEPEVVALCEYLVKCGADIKGIGSDCLIINGAGQLCGCCMKIPADRIVAGTYLFAVLAAGGNAWLEEAPCNEMQAVLQVAERMGALCQESPMGLYVQAPEELQPIACLRTGEYPDFPTDLQSAVTVAALRAKGETVIEETIFENRFHIVEPLKTMGADIYVLDERRILSKGGKLLRGRNVEAKELRGGAAMILAGLMTNDVTCISGCKYILRGYENIGKDLRELGARVVSV